ncbi:putative bifunctional diguanylate cyclase/phosphodiesterase [Bacillus sp. 2205SS5-2]|uniref:putative bifunctional diguanylate cyclase/phosphodiesterase n=1 Tax=Bacillus sp. 2205SS5-2 TaxID=3109031 RepID=UPI003004B613
MNLDMLVMHMVPLLISTLLISVSCYLVFQMVLSYGTKPVQTKTLKVDALLVAIILTIDAFLTMAFVSLELLMERAAIFVLSYFGITLVGVYALMWLLQKSYLKAFRHFLNGMIFTTYTIIGNFTSFSLLGMEVLEVKIEQVALAIILIAGVTFPFFRFLTQLTRESSTNDFQGQKYFWSGLMGFAIAGLPILVVNSIFPSSSLDLGLFHNESGIYVSYMIQILAMLIIWFIPDIFAENKLQKQVKNLKEREDWYYSLFENNPIAVFTFNTLGEIVETNPHVFTLTGYYQDHVLSRSFRPYVLKEDLPVIIKKFQAALKGLGSEFELHIVHKKGHHILTKVTIVPVITEGKVVGAHALVYDITKSREAERKIEYIAYHDDLTGLPNRRYLENFATKVLEQEDGKHAIMLLDLNRFKIINDTLGHAYGDFLLIEIAARLSKCIGKEDVVARMSGDEFIIILKDVEGKIDIQRVAKKIHCSLQNPVVINAHNINVSTSIGIAISPEDGEDMMTLLKKADIAMYTAKQKGNGVSFFYSSHLHERVINPIELEEDMRQALKNNEFELYYQPKFSTKSIQIVGFEALVRWVHPRKGIISPNHFIPLAEETGLIVPLGEYLLRQACFQMKAWEKEGITGLRVSVNVSSRQFHDEQFTNIVADVLEQTNLSPCALELEVTENTTMDNVYRAEKILNELNSMGVTISIDDFGVEYSSLSYLQKYSVDIIKIDRSFIDKVDEKSSNQAIVKAILAMAKHFQIEVVAEGVETEQQLQWLQQNQCDYVQGFYFSKPLPAEELKNWLLYPKVAVH